MVILHDIQFESSKHKVGDQQYKSQKPFSLRWSTLFTKAITPTPSTASRTKETKLPLLLNGSRESWILKRIAKASRDQSPDCERSFYITDLSNVYGQYLKWKQHLGDIQPFYAMKSNPDPYILRLLASLPGTGFDCASYGEISQILDLGVEPNRIVYANPCKAASFIRYARQCEVDLMTFDNLDELDKISNIHPGARLVLRIRVDDTGSIYKLGAKFGASMDAVPGLLSRAKELCLDVVGVSFHAGSGVVNTDIYLEALGQAFERARQVFTMGENIGYKFTLLDIGGGFQNDIFEQMAQVCRSSLSKYFPDRESNGIKVIAEPGQFFVANAFTLVTNIIGRRDNDQNNSTMLYINDGVFGSFEGTRMGAEVSPRAATINGSIVYEDSVTEDDLEPTMLWGPTCDSTDLICECVKLPRRLTVGDWLVFLDMGAYTTALTTRFNGFEPSDVMYTSGHGEHSVVVRNLLQL
ncbi:hypothetical protein M422DRAFT_245061 [Sphaerobolus stellatus SS14]|nr:hypothetical protein M422DRAFT_245061 [Sphaerobolus stellatus SS14]